MPPTDLLYVRAAKTYGRKAMALAYYATPHFYFDLRFDASVSRLFETLNASGFVMTGRLASLRTFDTPLCDSFRRFPECRRSRASHETPSELSLPALREVEIPDSAERRMSRFVDHHQLAEAPLFGILLVVNLRNAEGHYHAVSRLFSVTRCQYSNFSFKNKFVLLPHSLPHAYYGIRRLRETDI